VLLGSTGHLGGRSSSPPSSESSGGPRSDEVGVVSGTESAKEGTVPCSVPNRHGKYLSSNSACSEMQVWHVVGL